MKENIENKWEDSYQKRERLTRELSDGFKELYQSFKIGKKDIISGKELIERIETLEKELVKLDFVERRLLDDGKELTQRYKEISGKKMISEAEEESDKIIKATSDNQNKLNDVRNKISEIYDDMGKMSEEMTGLEGDISGIKALVESKIKKVQEIQRQISELEDNH